MDIVEWLRDITRQPPTREEAADEISKLRKALHWYANTVKASNEITEKGRSAKRALELDKGSYANSVLYEKV